MKECEVDGCNETALVSGCNYCSGSFCPDHQLPERHSCPHVKVANTHGPDFRAASESVQIGSEGEDSTANGEGSKKECAGSNCSTIVAPSKEFCRSCRVDQRVRQSVPSSPDVAADGSLDYGDSEDATQDRERPGLLSRLVPSISLDVIWIRIRGWMRSLLRLSSILLFLAGIAMMLSLTSILGGFVMMMVGLGLAYRWIVSDRVGSAAVKR